MAHDIDNIVTNLYVGGQQATRDPKALAELGVTHVVTVSDEPVKKIVDSGLFKYMFVQGLDMEYTDLLSHFPAVVDFIDKGVSSGATFVHCIAGVSRSVTMVMAFLMEKKEMTFDDALKLVQKRRKYANPNESFIKQLKLYKEMKFKLDPTNDEYRAQRLENLSVIMQGNQIRDSQSVFLPGDLTENPTDSKEDTIYKCKKCRKPLFKKSGVMKHTVGIGTAAFDWRAAQLANEITEETPKELCDRSLFIEPVEWMRDSITTSEGKLSCPKCNSKIGSFVWHGERCPCGDWVSPAFHIQTSKVDECKPDLPVIKPSLGGGDAQPKSENLKSPLGCREAKLKSENLKSPLGCGDAQNKSENLSTETMSNENT